MKYFSTILMRFLLCISLCLWAHQVLSQENRSLPYPQLLKEYENLTKQYSWCKLIPYGKTDCGLPLQLFVISRNGIFDPARLHELGYTIVFINNGIHPGEPDGMDASLDFARQTLNDNDKSPLIKKLVYCILPAFNIDGTLRRNNFSRVNQNGPEEYGFRGNDRNLDLNRDFMKMDSQNTLSLISILRKWNPDVFIDTHVSDGADYQYTMTLISTQHDKMNQLTGSFIKKTFTPEIFESMKKKKDAISPYVETFHDSEIPDSGLTAFMETPRFVSGYLSLFNCFAFISESHMLKPFDQRKASTLRIIQSICEISYKHSDEIRELRKRALDADLAASSFYYNWKLDESQKEMISFNGYKAIFEKSAITTHDRLRYDRSQPYTKEIPFYDHFMATDSLPIPKFIYLPQAWENIGRMLEVNHIRITRVREDSSVSAQQFYIEDMKTVSNPYEGHYLHYDIKKRMTTNTILMRKGDFIIDTRQEGIRFIMEALVPDANDSYFAWGFFDSILQQKEWFSAYIFEDLAKQILAENVELNKSYHEWLLTHADEDSYSQLYYIYSHSKYFEKSYRLFPCGFIY